MDRRLFSSSVSLLPLFLGIALPYVPLPGSVRLVNVFWGVVYGAGFFVIDWFGAFHPTQRSPAVFFAFIVWPVFVSGALFMIGNWLHRTTGSRLRLVSMCLLMASALALTTLDSALQSSLP